MPPVVEQKIYSFVVFHTVSIMILRAVEKNQKRKIKLQYEKNIEKKSIENQGE
jgi:hypothetical protein